MTRLIHWHATLPTTLLVGWLLCLTGAQRAAVNLGAKKQSYTVSGETHLASMFVFPFRQSSLSIVATVCTFILLLVGYRLTQRKEKGQAPLTGTKNGSTTASSSVLDSVDLAFEGVQLTLEKKRGQKRVILDGSLRGRARPGRMLAIMGPSGAGKSTVLHAIAGRIKETSGLSLYGKRHVNGHALSGSAVLPSAFVEQDVQFFAHMTVQETLAFRVELEMGSTMSRQEKDRMVQDLLNQVGLQKTANTVVGGPKVRGISGGERKRLSIALEMISSPALLFLDEPTSGLDSTAATALVQTLHELATVQGKTIVAVIHQPSQHVFSKFDDLLLVSEGKLYYYGERSKVRAYMDANGCQALPEMGTAEHILDCISRAPIEDETQEQANERMERLAQLARQDTSDLGIQQEETSSKALKHLNSGASLQSGPRANIFRQFRLLLKRSFREVSRGKLKLVIKLVQQVTTAVIYGGIYKLGSNQASIMDRFGLLSLIAIGITNLAIAQTIRSFPREKAIVSNEIASKMYRTLPYFVGKALSELPLVGIFNGIFGSIVYFLTGLDRAPGKFRNFLTLLVTHGLTAEATGLLIGAYSPDSDVALAIFPAVIVLNIIFDGKNISEENTPKYLRWISKIGLIRWGFEGLAVNEFEGLNFDASGPRRGPVAKTGADALARFGLGSRSLRDVFSAQMMITGGCWLLSYIGLSLTRQKYMTMKPPPAEKASR